MDRTRKIAGGAVLSCAALLIGGCGQSEPSQSARSYSPAEPARLHLDGLQVAQLESRSLGRIVPTSAESDDAEPVVDMPEFDALMDDGETIPEPVAEEEPTASSAKPQQHSSRRVKVGAPRLQPVPIEAAEQPAPAAPQEVEPGRISSDAIEAESEVVDSPSEDPAVADVLRRYAPPSAIIEAAPTEPPVSREVESRIVEPRKPVTVETMPRQPETVLPPAAPVETAVATPARPPVIAAAVGRADEFTREGFRLAERGALFSARSQFLQALRTMVSAQDELQGTNQFTKSFNAGLRAMDEAHDFELRHASDTHEIDVARLVAGHRTKLITDAEAAQMRPAAARDRYELFACEQMTAAFTGEKVASIAMYGLGRVEAATGKLNANADGARGKDALVWYHAALMVDNTNFRAAHELGSLYAKRGEWNRAREALIRAAALSPSAATMSNLAIVHAKLGENQLAAAAQGRAKVMTDPNASTGMLPPVQWVDAETFAKSTGPNDAFLPNRPPVVEGVEPIAKQDARTAQKSKSKAASKTTAKTPNTDKPKSIAKWLPFNMPKLR